MFQDRGNLSHNLTSYDFLKSVAVILMVIDHIGLYFFYNEEWFRVIGRLCVPIWFFLVGYARSRDLSSNIWWGMLILVWANFTIGTYILPLNILASIIIVRLIIDFVAENMLLEKAYFFIINMVLLVFVFFINLDYIFEYGAMGVFLAIAGYLIRNKDNISWSKYSISAYIFFIWFLYGAIELYNISIYADLDIYMISFFVLFMGLIYYWLYNFRAEDYPNLTLKLPKISVSLLHFTGRQTLFIYVFHVILFKIIAVMIGYAYVDWFYLRLLS